MLNTARKANAMLMPMCIFIHTLYSELSLLSLSLLIVICQPLKHIPLLRKLLEAFYNTFSFYPLVGYLILIFALACICSRYALHKLTLCCSYQKTLPAVDLYIFQKIPKIFLFFLS